MLFLVFAAAPWMIVVGFVLVGLAVGADIPASWSLIAEMAPDNKRGRHSGVAQVLWYLGPVIVLISFVILEPFGILGAQIVFAHLALLAIALTLLRSRMKESERWEHSKRVELGNPASAKGGTWRVLLQRQHVKSMVFLVAMYGFWNLWAGTNGFFFPYILQTVGDQSQSTAVAIQAGGFILAMVSIYFVFMKLSDKVDQRLLFGISAVMQIAGMALLAIFPLTIPVALLYIFLLQFGGGFGAQSFFQLWSAELFPTAARATAQGVTFAIVRISLGIFSFFVPMLTSIGFTTLAWILVGFLTVSATIGIIWAPRNQGKSLEDLERERASSLAGTSLVA
jgi:inositol transporter-like SP family MFS transporter